MNKANCNKKQQQKKSKRSISIKINNHNKKKRKTVKKIEKKRINSYSSSFTSSLSAMGARSLVTLPLLLTGVLSTLPISEEGGGLETVDSFMSLTIRVPCGVSRRTPRSKRGKWPKAAVPNWAELEARPSWPHGLFELDMP